MVPNMKNVNGKCEACGSPVTWNGPSVNWGDGRTSLITPRNLDRSMHWCKDKVKCPPECKVDIKRFWTAMLEGGNYLETCNHAC